MRFYFYIMQYFFSLWAKNRLSGDCWSSALTFDEVPMSPFCKVSLSTRAEWICMSLLLRWPAYFPILFRSLDIADHLPKSVSWGNLFINWRKVDIKWYIEIFRLPLMEERLQRVLRLCSSYPFLIFTATDFWKGNVQTSRWYAFVFLISFSLVNVALIHIVTVQWWN